MKKTLVASACMLSATYAAFSAIDTNNIDSTRGFPITGKTASDKLGYTVTSAGDFDNDNKNDLLITSSVGKAYIVFGKGAAQTKAAFDLNDADRSTEFITLSAVVGTDTDLVGALAGDVNGDNIDDIIIGVPGATSNAGQAYVVYGTSTRADIDLTALSAGGLAADKGFSFDNVQGTDKFGSAVAGAGDFNGDNKDDVLIYSASTDGSLLVIYGAANTDRSANPDLTDATSLGTNGVIIAGPTTSNFGASLAKLGDLNADNKDDILVGAPGEAKAYIVYGTNAATIDISTTSKVEITGTASSKFGQSVAMAGDFNSDGKNDIIIAAPEEAVTAGNTEGRVYVIFGQTTLSSSIAATSLGDNGLTISGATTTEKLGWSVAGVDDINQDGVDDIVISAEGSEKVYVLFGKLGINDDIDLSQTLAANVGATITGQADSDFGKSVSAIGDVNGDGLNDFVITAPIYDYKIDDSTTRTEAGAAWVIYGAQKDNEKFSFRLGASISMLAGFLIALMI